MINMTLKSRVRHLCLKSLKGDTGTTFGAGSGLQVSINGGDVDSVAGHLVPIHQGGGCSDSNAARASF